MKAKNVQGISYSVTVEKSVLPFDSRVLMPGNRLLIGRSAGWLTDQLTLVKDVKRLQKLTGDLYSKSKSRLNQSVRVGVKRGYEWLDREMFQFSYTVKNYSSMLGCELSPYAMALLESRQQATSLIPNMHALTEEGVLSHEAACKNIIMNVLKDKLKEPRFKRKIKSGIENVRQNKADLSAYLDAVLTKGREFQVLRINLNYIDAFSLETRAFLGQADARYQPQQPMGWSAGIDPKLVKVHWQNFRKRCVKTFGDSVEGFAWKLEVCPDFGPRYHLLLILKSTADAVSIHQSIDGIWCVEAAAYTGVSSIYDQYHRSGLVQTGVLPANYQMRDELIRYYCKYFFDADCLYRPMPKVYGRSYGRGVLSK